MNYFAHTAVWYHMKKPRFFDELKIQVQELPFVLVITPSFVIISWQLPFELKQKACLVFTIYHINCKNPKKSKDPIRNAIAYTFLPLYSLKKCVSLALLNPRWSLTCFLLINRLPTTGEHELQLYSKLPSNFHSIDPDSLPVSLPPISSQLFWIIIIFYLLSH